MKKSTKNTVKKSKALKSTIITKVKAKAKSIPATNTIINDKNVQFSIDYSVKHRVDVFKAKHKEDIIAKYRLSRRHISNTDAIRYLLDKVGE